MWKHINRQKLTERIKQQLQQVDEQLGKKPQISITAKKGSNQHVSSSRNRI